MFQFDNIVIEMRLIVKDIHNIIKEEYHEAYFNDSRAYGDMRSCSN